MSPSKIRKYLLKIYHDLINGMNENIVMEFNEIDYEIRVEGKQNTIYLALKSIPIVTNVGDNVFFPFFSAHLGERFFYVKSIRHWFYDQKQTILIHLCPDDYNLYWHLRRDKAFAINELTFDKLFRSSEYELRKILLHERREQKI
ncbi:MAG: hypothetical protein ACOCP4_05280 [Candidatus Woesearchaeota archaeon]